MNEVHEADPGVPAEMGLERPHGAAAADRLVRTLFRLRGLRRAVPLKRFAIEILGLRFVECTHTTAVAVGRIRRLRVAAAIEVQRQPYRAARD